MKDKKELKEKILDITSGVFSTLTDLTLFVLFCGYESLVDPRFFRSFNYSMRKVEKIQEMIAVSKIKRALRYTKEMGWVDEELKISKEGEERLKGVLFQSPPSFIWDGKWYLVNFDIPEKFSRKRNILRENLKRLGFKKLQNSVWISPRDFLGNIEKIVKEYDLGPFVIFSITSKIGPLQAKKLAERIWRLDEIRKEYQNFIKKYGADVSGKKYIPFGVIFDYRQIAEKDPQLPLGLLPDGWEGEKAFKIYNLHLKLKLELS